MTTVTLWQLDGRVNLALMRISEHHKKLGHQVELVHAGNPRSIQRQIRARAAEGVFGATGPVYASLIFTRTRPLAEMLLAAFPHAVIGGTGWDFGKDKSERMTLERAGVLTKTCDYTLYPTVKYSLGFSMRGCRLACTFCDVPKAEGKATSEGSIASIWRGEPFPRHMLLLDNDPFGNPSWKARFNELREGKFSVCFNQGFNARTINQAHADEIASLDCRDTQFDKKRVYVAWDNKADEKPLMRGLNCLVKAGVIPRNIMVYVLVGFDHEEAERLGSGSMDLAARALHEDDFYRVKELRAFGALPYPMPFVRPCKKTTEDRVKDCPCRECVLGKPLTGFARWVVRDYDKRGVTWEDFKANDCRPEGLGEVESMPLFDGAS